MGQGDAFKIEDFRRMLVNACYWCIGLEEYVNPRLDISIVGKYEPGPVGGKGLQTGLKPDDPLFAMPAASAISAAPVRSSIDGTQPGWRWLLSQPVDARAQADHPRQPGLGWAGSGRGG